MIRQARLDDIIQILPLVKEFANEIGDKYLVDNYSNKGASNLIKFCIESGVCLVLEIDGNIEGIVAGTASRNLWNPRVSQLDEQVYYLSKEYRRSLHGWRMIHEYAKYAKDYDVSTLKLMKSSPDLEKHYNKLGYNYLERSFVKYGD